MRRQVTVSEVTVWKMTALALIAGAVGCDRGREAEPTPADQIPEVSYDSVSLAEHVVEAGDHLRLPVLEAPLGATRVGVHLTLSGPDAGAPQLEARGLDEDGEPTGAWRPLEITWREGDQLVGLAELGELSSAAELRMRRHDEGAIGLLTWSAIVPEVTREEQVTDDPGAIGAARESLRSDIAALGVVSREEWGARATRCSTRNASKDRMAIHHTVSGSGGDPAASLRGIQRYHMDTRGWCDIGYHFLVSIDGRLWEGRPVHLLGAHVGGHNTGNIGVSFIGCFHSSSCSSFPPNVPPDVMVQGGAGLVAGLADIYGIAISRTTVKGHRDHSGQTTSCPGDHLHARLDDIRDGSPPDYAAQYVEQTFPLARDPFELAPGEVSSGYLEMRNAGAATWRPGETFLGTTEPRDVASPIAGPDWVSPSRAATIDREVPPGSTGRFVFSVKAPPEPGDYPQYFNLVQEGVAWFSDPGQGGPPDAQLQIRVTVLDVPPVDPPPEPEPESEPDAGAPELPSTDGGAPPPPPTPTADAGASAPPASSSDAGAPSTGGGLSGGCSAAAVAAPAGAPAWLLCLAALAWRRRRRAR